MPSICHAVQNVMYKEYLSHRDKSPGHAVKWRRTNKTREVKIEIVEIEEVGGYIERDLGALLDKVCLALTHFVPRPHKSGVHVWIQNGCNRRGLAASASPVSRPAIIRQGLQY